MPGQLDVIRRHIDDALARGGRAVLGGPDAVQPPYVHPTILVDVPEDSAAVREETFGPTLTVNRVRDVDEAVERANALPYGLGGVGLRPAAGGGRSRAGCAPAWRRSIRRSPSSGCPRCPSAGSAIPASAGSTATTGLREFGRAKAIARRRFRPPMPVLSFTRSRRTDDLVARLVRLVHGRR